MPSPQDSLAVLNSGHTAKSGYGVLIHGAGAPTDGTSGTLGAILYWDETNKVLRKHPDHVHHQHCTSGCLLLANG